MQYLKENLKLVVIVVVAAFAIFSLMVIAYINQNSSVSEQSVHVSIRPLEAVPVTITTAKGIIGTYVEPEFDIIYTNDMEFLQFASTSYESTDKLMLDSTSITVNMKQKDVISGEEGFIDIISDDKVFKLDDEYAVRNYTEFGEGRWILGTLTTIGEETDGEKVLIERKTNENIIITAGTDLDVELMRSAGIPENTINSILGAVFNE